MTGAWGLSWGDSWGVSWGLVANENKAAFLRKKARRDRIWELAQELNQALSEDSRIAEAAKARITKASKQAIAIKAMEERKIDVSKLPDSDDVEALLKSILSEIKRLQRKKKEEELVALLLVA